MRTENIVTDYSSHPHERWEYFWTSVARMGKRAHFRGIWQGKGKVAKRDNLRHSHHEKEMIIMWYDGGVGWHYSGDNVIYKCIRINMLYILNSHNDICRLLL